MKTVAFRPIGAAVMVMALDGTASAPIAADTGAQASAGDKGTAAVPPIVAKPEFALGPGAALSAADLPQGFEPLAQSDLARMELDTAKLAAGISRDYTEGKVENLRTFMNPRGAQMVMSWAALPLTVLEKAAFDSAVKDPAKAAKNIGFKKCEILADSLKLGERSIGFAGYVGKIHVNLVIVQRGNVMQVLLVYDPEPSFRSVDVARVVDQRIAAALSPDGVRSATDQR